MKKMRAWISAARLRTLPLSLSGILMGTAYAGWEQEFGWTVFLLAIATTLGLQILSNFANDYGDGVKGTDNEDRLGPTRAVQSGIVSHRELKVGVIITALVTLGLALFLIFTVFNQEELIYALIFLGLGILAIIAAITYTVGKKAYGYSGWGDLFVFLFFGWLSVIGSSFLYSKSFQPDVFLPASCIGFLSAAVLNLNNMRDRLSDTNSGKITLAVRLGQHNAKIYHFALILLAFIALILFLYLENLLWQFLSIIPFGVLFLHLKKVAKIKNPKEFDPELKKVSLSTFAVSILFLLTTFLS